MVTVVCLINHSATILPSRNSSACPFILRFQPEERDRYLLRKSLPIFVQILLVTATWHFCPKKHTSILAETTRYIIYVRKDFCRRLMSHFLLPTCLNRLQSCSLCLIYALPCYFLTEGDSGSSVTDLISEQINMLHRTPIRKDAALLAAVSFFSPSCVQENNSSIAYSHPLGLLFQAWQ